MTSQQRTGPAVLVPLAAGIDTATCEQVRLCPAAARAAAAPARIPRSPAPPAREVP